MPMNPLDAGVSSWKLSAGEVVERVALDVIERRLVRKLFGLQKS